MFTHASTNTHARTRAHVCTHARVCVRAPSRDTHTRMQIVPVGIAATSALYDAARFGGFLCFIVYGISVHDNNPDNQVNPSPNIPEPLT